MNKTLEFFLPAETQLWINVENGLDHSQVSYRSVYHPNEKTTKEEMLEICDSDATANWASEGKGGSVEVIILP